MAADFKKHFDELYNFSLRMTGSYRKGEKLTIKIIEEAAKAEKYRAEEDIRMYLLRIAVNLYGKFYYSDPGTSVDINNDFKKHSSYLDKIQVSEAFKQMDDSDSMKLLMLLPSNLRLVLVLKELSNLQYKFISELLDIPEGIVIDRLALGRKFIYNELVKEG
jgi:DNA-directed RNA polymerase specialized sigma24 family protein